MSLFRKFFVKDSYAFGSLLAVISPIVLLFALNALFFLVAELINFVPYNLEKFYLLSLAGNILLMRYYLVNLKMVKTGKSILVVTFLFVVLYFIFQ